MERKKSLKTLITEKRLVDVLVSFLRNDNLVAREVRHYEKSIDVVAMPHENYELNAVEVKTSNWGKAIQQAVVNLAVAEKSYIAMYEKNVHRVNLDELNQYGIGLISVGTSWGDVKVVHEAQRSSFLNKITNSRVKELLKKRVSK